MKIRMALVGLFVSGSVLINPAEAVASVVPMGIFDPAKAVAEWNNPKGKIVEVVNKMPANWPVKKSVGFVDKYTTSKVKYVARCSGRAWKCYTIRPGKIKTDHIGMYYGGKSLIVIDTKKAKRYGYAGSSAFRKYLIAHEFAHYCLHGKNGGHSHGNNLMYPKAKRNGKYIPLKLNHSQRVTLKKC